jgi:hypothetical protein
VRALGIILIGIAAVAPAGAQQPPSQPPTCSAPEYRQFDFWVGDWEVVDSAGKVLGTNRITREMKDCVVHEHWTGAGGNTGESFNIYRRGTGTWHQSWVDSSGSLLLLEGGLEEGAMVLRAEFPGRNGGTQQHRITYTPLADGRVRQLWEVSADGGQTWQASFDGYYRRRAP